MDTLLYLVASCIIACIQALPLGVAVRLGRCFGLLGYLLDARHRRVAFENLTACFGQERTPAELKRIVRENYARIGENWTAAVKTAAMTNDELRPYLNCVGFEAFLNPATRPKSAVFALGHFGNFEMYARISVAVQGYVCATTYRGLRQPSVNRLMQKMREKSGVLYFDRRGAGTALKELMHKGGVMLGLLADQHAGDKGLPAPFFGRICSTSAAPMVFALRYDCPLYTTVCYRTAPGRWTIELGPEVSLHENGHARPLVAIATDINEAFEVAVRRDPANWFWVHKRWKPGRHRAVVATETTPEE